MTIIRDCFSRIIVIYLKIWPELARTCNLSTVPESCLQNIWDCGWNKVKINKKDSIFAKDNLWKFNCVLNKNSHWFPQFRSPSEFYNNSWKNSWKPNFSQKCRNSKRQIKSVSFQIAIQEQKMQYQSNYFHFQLTEQCTKNGKDRQSSIT